MRNILIQERKSDKLQLNLTVQRVEPSVWYSLGFYKHHYLTESLNKSCKCLLFRWNGVPCAFVAVLNTPRRGIPYGFAISRIVVLPDFQGLGLSSKILNFVGSIVLNSTEGARMYIKTIHELMGAYFTNSDKWRPTAFNGKQRSKKDQEFERGKYNNRLQRASFCFEYIGDKQDGYEELLLPIKELRDKKKCGKQLEIKFD